MKIYPYEKGGGGRSFSNAEGGHKKFWGSFYVVACFSHILGGARKVSTLEQGGGLKSFTLS